jgi:hypothetical protein
MGRGDLTQLVHDFLDDLIFISQYLVIPKSDYSVARAFDSPRAYCIQRPSLVVCMSVAIEFDYKAGWETNEVGDVLAQGMLPAELVSVQLPPSKV